MKQIVQHKRSGRIEVLEVPDPQIGPRFVRIRTLASVISAGTEKSTIELGDRSLLGKARARPELTRKVLHAARTQGVQSTIETVRSRLNEVGALGYSLAGVVEEVGREVDGIAPGDLVSAAGAGYANHAQTVVVPCTLVARVPANVSAADAAFGTLGAIALQGLRQAAPLIGETFLVVGLGLIGQITVQLLRANGCRVIAIDLQENLVARAKAYGALGVSAGEDASRRIIALTAGHGVDGVILTASTRSSQPIELAAVVTREKGRVVVVGAVGLNLPREPLYLKEIEIRISRSYGPGRYDRRHEEGGQDYPFGYVRFTERRNLEAFLQLMSEGRIIVESLVTHRFPIDRAPEAYNLLRGKRNEPYMGIVIEYPDQNHQSREIALALRRRSISGQVSVSFIGAGNYATSRLLPPLKADQRVRLHGVCTGSGLKARSIGERFGFELCNGDAKELLDQKTDVIFIATRHDTHAHYVIEALKAGKHVFVEKPLCLSLDELSRIEHVATAAPGHLLVGYNRRFAPLTRTVIEFMRGAASASVINVRINAGEIEANHWINDPLVGGGRILGEACHFIDLAMVLSGTRPRRVFARALPKPSVSPLLSDDVAITLTMNDGSIATIVYSASGGRAMRKERIEFMREGRSAVIDDFIQAQFYSEQRSRRLRRWTQDKGQGAMLDAFLGSLKSSKPLVPLIDLLAVSEATLAVVNSLATGKEVVLSGGSGLKIGAQCDDS